MVDPEEDKEDGMGF
jgi:hypothetical protein